jgi:hypothetical protein
LTNEEKKEDLDQKDAQLSMSLKVKNKELKKQRVNKNK